MDLFVANDPKRITKCYRIAGIFVIDARHGSHFDYGVLWPDSLEGSQQVRLESLELSINEFRRINKVEDVDTTVPLLDVPREGLAPVFARLAQQRAQRRHDQERVVRSDKGNA